MDPNLFFREATLKICGSLDSEKALWDSLMYLRQHMPVVRLSFHVYDADTGSIGTVGRQPGHAQTSHAQAGHPLRTQCQVPFCLRTLKWQDTSQLFEGMEKL